MSRIGRKPILIPEGVEVGIDKNTITIQGPKGKLFYGFRPEVKVEVKERKIFILPQLQTKQTNAFWGLTRALLANMVKGVVSGYEKQLQIEGVGYRAETDGNNLVLQVGFTHPIKITAPESIKFTVEKNIITVSGIDKGLVSLLAAKIKKVKPPEPYKGKGIRYVGEKIRKKVGKRAEAVAAATAAS